MGMNNEAGNAAIETYNMYGNRQDEFGYLPDWAQAEVVEYCHAMANLAEFARGMQVVTVTASGLRITRAMLDEEIRSTRIERPRTSVAYFPRSVTEVC